MAKKVLVGVVAVAGVVVLAAIGLALFLDANQFRPALAAKMGEALGRRVEIGSLKVSWLAGGIAAEDLVITDDPAFSKQPFVTAKSVSFGVDLKELIFSRSLRVESFTLAQPRVALIRAASGAWNFSSLGSGGSSSSGSMGAITVLVQKITIASGAISVQGLDGSRTARSYDAVDVTVKNLSLSSAFPFSVSAKAPAGGSLTVNGDAGPFNLSDIARTPFHGAVTIAHLDAAQTGLVDPASGIGGVLDFDGTLASDGAVVTTKGKATVTGARLLPGAAASSVPLAIDYESSFNEKAQAGTLRKADVSIGKATAHVIGDYKVSGATTSVKLMLRGTKMPLTELQGALPALGVTLPQGAVVQQGVLDLELSIAGPVDKLTISGPIAATNTKLTGFDLSQKMGAIASLAGLQRVGDTLIEELTGSLRMTPDGIQIDTFNMVVPAIGTLTGAGTIAPQGAMNFPMLAKLRQGAITSPVSSDTVNKVLSYGQTSGVPFRIQGTTSNPVFVPDVGRAMKGATDQLKEAAKNPENIKKATDSLIDLFKRKTE